MKACFVPRYIRPARIVRARQRYEQLVDIGVVPGHLGGVRLHGWLVLVQEVQRHVDRVRTAVAVHDRDRHRIARLRLVVVVLAPLVPDLPARGVNGELRRVRAAQGVFQRVAGCPCPSRRPADPMSVPGDRIFRRGADRLVEEFPRRARAVVKRRRGVGGGVLVTGDPDLQLACRRRPTTPISMHAGSVGFEWTSPQASRCPLRTPSSLQ